MKKNIKKDEIITLNDVELNISNEVLKAKIINII